METKPIPTMGEFVEKNGSIVLRYWLQAAARQLIPDERIKVCMRWRVPGQDIQLWHLPTSNRGHFTGLMRCGSVWTCPVCQAPITEQRRIELQTAIESNRKTYLTFLVTYTMQHRAGENLDSLIKSLGMAYRKMRSGRMWQTVKDEYMIQHGVRAMEITYGDNGWHPHYHELLFVSADILPYIEQQEIDRQTGDVKQSFNFDEFGKSLEAQLSDLWVGCLKRFNRYGSTERALTVSTKPGDVAAYLQKYGYAPQKQTGWTESHEIAKQPAKRANLDGRTPLELLWEYSHGNRQSGALWREYASATKGKSHLQWTRGAKDELGVGQLTDQQALEKDDLTPDKILLAHIPLELWRVIVREERQAQLLRAAADNNPHEISRILANLRPS